MIDNRQGSGPTTAVSAVRLAGILLRQRMPLGEIGAVLRTRDPEVVHRYLELHRERLEERLDAQVEALAPIERRSTELSEGVLCGPPAGSAPARRG